MTDDDSRGMAGCGGDTAVSPAEPEASHATENDANHEHETESDTLTLPHLDGADEHDEEEETGEEEHGPADRHVWLSVHNVEQMSDQMAQTVAGELDHCETVQMARPTVNRAL